jgi:23S rRNA (guanosine2251-2'-O)-methyltransferase
MLDKLQWQHEKIALVFGNEVTGVNDEALILADGSIEIPQWGSKHSLNIAVSIGVVLWELVRNSGVDSKTSN